MQRVQYSAPPLCSPASIRIDVNPCTAGREAKLGKGRLFQSAEELTKRAEHVHLMLKQLLTVHPSAQQIARYLRCTQIVIDPNATSSHSFPVITLTIQFSSPSTDMEQLRSLFIHEQLHWLVGPPNPLTNTVLMDLIGELKELSSLKQLRPCKDLTSLLGERAQSGVDLHIVVNWLEYRANVALLGSESKAKELLLESGSYEEIYAAVFDHEDDIRKIFRNPRYQFFLTEKEEAPNP